MRDLLLYSGQADNYRKSCEDIEKYLRVKADDSQLNRLCVHYGERLEAHTQGMESDIVARSTELSQEVGEEEVVYAMFDGCMLPTRPHQTEEEEIGSWKEMKLGRIFRQSDHLDLGEKPNVIRRSIYVSHFGKHQAFTEKLSGVVDQFERLNERLVCINDGAVWIENFIQEQYPNATDILDFYHASAYLHDFSKAVFCKKDQQTQRKQWVDKQIAALLDDQVDCIIETIAQMACRGKVQIEARKRILDYYTRNKHRMRYKTYRDKGLLIGSGPIESAHRFVLQKRMKQSGQKWTKRGGQAIANLRVFHLNQQWNKVIDLINHDVKKAA